MSENTRYQIQSVSYNTVAEAFLEEAGTLISDSAIQETLDTEKIRFENASLLQISPEKLVSHNTARYCKDLLRKQQPFPFLYLLLSFLTEISSCLIPYGIIIEICHYFSKKNGSPFPFPTLYGLLLIIGLVTANTLYRQYMRKLLSKPLENSKNSQTTSGGLSSFAAKKTLTRFKLLVYCVSAAAILSTILLAAFLEWDNIFSLRLSGCFIAYVSCILLSGIHNILYSSHFLSFFTIGILLVIRRPEAEIKTATKQYLNLRYLQMLTPAHKTLSDLKNNEELEKKLRESLHSRMITQRIYDLFAIVIFFTLDAVCISQLRSDTTPAFICFFVLSVLLTCVLLLAFISANHILKNTK